MRKTILFLSVLFIIGILNAGLLFANNIATSDPNKDIELLGDLNNTGTRSLSPPILTSQYSDHITVTMSRFLGEISVKIYDGTNNVVYDETIDSSIQSVSINTAFLEAGEYSIQFTNSQGQYLYGNFVI